VLSVLPQQEVVIPAFTCPVVKTAVKLAGKRIVYVDVARYSINSTCAEFEREMKPGRVLIPTHLFGIPTDIERICELARARGCVTIEDAAAAFGATKNGHVLGTVADVGIFSFERSKRVPAFRGAAIAINNERLIERSTLSARSPTAGTCQPPIRELAFAFLYNLATIPSLYGRITLPRLLQRYATMALPVEDEAVDTVTTSPFYTRNFHPLQARIVLRVLGRLNRIREHIERLVETYESTFRDTAIQQFTMDDCDRGGMLRFPIAFSGKLRADVLRCALGRGIYLETNYERPLPERCTWDRFPNALWAAENLVLLPLYTSLSISAGKRLAASILGIYGDIQPAEFESQPECEIVDSGVDAG
jgi:dTDP-4-amino-4,6-dideoxygalactose transaminase